MKILSIFNTFANLRQESDPQFQGYIDGLTSVLMQRGIKQDIVWSSCLNTPSTRCKLMDIFEQDIYYSFIDQLEPLPVTVNLTAMKMDEKYGPYDAFLYIDSGIRFLEEHQLAKFLHVHQDTKAGMTSCVTDTDGGYFECLHWGNYIDDYRDIDSHFTDGIFRIPIGGACNLHCQFFDRSIFETFNNKIYVDSFAGQASESVFSHICASVGKSWILTNKIKVQHLVGMDGASSGFSPAEWVRKGNNRLDHPYKIDSIFRVIREGQKYGLGIQEFSSEGIQSDKSKFDENGFALDPQLKYYIRDNLFVPKSLLDYDKIKYQLIKL